MAKFISVCVVIVVLAVCATIERGCQIIYQSSTEQASACIQAGGSWVPAGTNSAYQCINKN